MNEFGKKLRRNLFGDVNPYSGFQYEEYSLDLFGWGSTHPNFEHMIDTIRPKFIIEVGSWKGASAINMARIAQEKKIDFHLLCIDTWLGGLEIWLNKEDPNFYNSLLITNGHPKVYYQFLANVMRCGFENVVTPFTQTSCIAARWLKIHKIQADLIYIDASHDESDVYADMVAYWEIVKPGGALFGDDYHKWEGVRAAVSKFSEEYGVPYEIKERQWVFFRK